MTYCLGIGLDDGLVFVSDSRTSAGPDQVATYSKLHVFANGSERQIVVLSAGNLGTTQAVVHHARRDIESNKEPNLFTVEHLAEAAGYLGELSRGEQSRYAEGATAGFDATVSFIVGGEIAGEPHELYLVYPQGNYIQTSEATPFFQIGETKFAKPMLDLLIRRDLSLEDAARVGLVAMDSTMAANVIVGPPIELLLYKAGSFELGPYLQLADGDEYVTSIRSARDAALRKMLNGLPPLPLDRAHPTRPG